MEGVGDKSYFSPYFESTLTFINIKGDNYGYSSKIFGGTFAFGTQFKWIDLRGEIGYFAGKEKLPSYQYSYSGPHQVLAGLVSCGLVLPFGKTGISLRLSPTVGTCSSKHYGGDSESYSIRGAEAALSFPTFKKGYVKIIAGLLKSQDAEIVRISLAGGSRF